MNAAEQRVVREALATWRSRLLDLSKRNRLLHFRRTRSSTLKVALPELYRVFDLLVSSQESKPIFEPAQRTEESRGGHENLWPEQDAVSRPAEAELVTDIEDRLQLRNALTNLYRRARSEYEERGIRVLHIAFGILSWRETDGSEESHAPLVLLPVELVRQKARPGFALRNCEEDAVLNPCIESKLHNDFQIELPGLPEEAEDLEIQDYLSAIASCVRDHGWLVKNEVWLSLFSFHKLDIYKDLEQNEARLMENPIVRALAGVGADLPEPDLPTERELDDKVLPDDSHLILEADSSQMMAIEAAKAGRSFILQGPPGTGKSQTIANLIAECIALGKRVLFVSEKMAALEVVYKRLAERNLETYMLQLHSHKANKREVIDNLYLSLKEQDHVL